MSNYRKLYLLTAGLLLSAGALAVDPTPYVMTEPLTVDGSFCTGRDCVAGESFLQSAGRPDLAVKLKENNLRISFRDTSAFVETRDSTNTEANYYVAFPWGNTWKMTGNDSANGGLNELSIGLAGVGSGLGYSNGAATDYSCTAVLVDGRFYGRTEVTPLDDPIPAGQPAKTMIFDIQSYIADGTERCLNVGETGSVEVNEKNAVFGVKATRDFAEEGAAPDIREVPGVVALGYGAKQVAEALSVGNSTSQRRIANLADGINELDLVTRGQLRKLPFEAQVQTIRMVNDQLDALEAQVAQLESRYSVPVITSGAAFTFLENENSEITLTATDSNGDDLTFGFKAGQDLPAWLSLSAAGQLTGTPVNESGRVFDAIIEVTDGFNVVEQTLTITVLDAEVTAISMAAGLSNGITYVELNAVDGVDAAIEANNAKYQAAIQARTGTDLDSPEEIAALVASVNSVPVYTGLTELLISNETTSVYGLSASDATGDTTAFALLADNPDWVGLTLLDNVQTLSFTPATNVTGVFSVALTLSDDFANTVAVTLSVTVNTASQVTILGNAVVGEILSASVSDVNGTTGSVFSYSWMSGADAVGNGPSYELTESDLGEQISISVFFSDDLGVLEMASAATGTVISREENAANTIENSVGDALAEAPTLEDYQLVGVGNVSDAVLTRILPILNRAVANQASDESVDTAEEIEALIDVIMEGQDDDNDGLPNLFEGDSGIDTDRDGIADRDDVDADSDGIRDNLEYGRLLAEIPDGDGDGISDIFDAYDHRYDWVYGTDDNNDGVNDDVDTPAELIAYYQARVAVPVMPGTVVAAAKGYAYNLVDVDEDGLINSLDMDSDNDGVSDLVEAGHIDSNEDGLLDNLADLISDLTLLPDTDTDGLPDFFELFSNGVDRDLILAGIRAALDLDEDGRIDSTTDVDRDGLMDVIDNAIGAFGSLPDYDGDGIPNHLDEDDDGDGIPDSEENDQFIYFTGEDADADGIDDGVDAEVNGVILGVDTNNNGVRDDRELPDLDGDGIADFLDNDADNDGILDNVDTEIALPVIPEPTTPTIPGTPTTPDQSSGADADVDGDGIPDSRDVSINTGNDVTTGSGAMAQGFYMIILAILGITARGRRHAKSLVTPLLTSLLLALGLIAPAASADSISAGGAIGFTRFSPEVNIEPTQNDYTDAGVFFDLGYHFSPEWAALLQYANLGEVNVNTADIPYRAVAAMAQYRPEWARSDSGWGLSLRLGASSVETGAERGLNLEKKESTFVMYSVGADFDVSESERLEILLSSYASDAKSLTFGYRVLFDL